MDFKNKVIVISGTHSGIGKGCADLLLQSGAAVVGIDLKPCTITHENYSHYLLDIRSESEVKKAVHDLIRRFGKLDGLVNAAGIYSNVKPFYEMTSEEWEQVIAVNLTGTFMLSKYIVQNMLKSRSGKIVNISCIRSKIFRPHMADYAASKAGVVALTSAMALDLKEHNIHVNSVAPGFTYTQMTSKAFDNPAFKELSESLIPTGRIAQPEDISKAVLFLLSDMADYINGETLYVDGGYSISK